MTNVIQHSRSINSWSSWYSYCSFSRSLTQPGENSEGIHSARGSTFSFLLGWSHTIDLLIVIDWYSYFLTDYYSWKQSKYETNRDDSSLRVCLVRSGAGGQLPEKLVSKLISTDISAWSGPLRLTSTDSGQPVPLPSRPWVIPYNFSNPGQLVPGQPVPLFL